MHTISKTTKPFEPRHFDDEGEEIIDDGVQELIAHDPPVHMLYGFESVVDVELGRHLNKAEDVNKAHASFEHETHPALMLFVVQRVNHIQKKQGDHGLH